MRKIKASAMRDLSIVYDKKINFLALTEQENEIGQIQVIDTPIKSAWARIEPLRGREYYEAKKLQTENHYKITTRYHIGITSDMLIQYNDQLFEIKEIVNPYLSNEKLEFMCIEKVKKDV